MRHSGLNQFFIITFLLLRLCLCAIKTPDVAKPPTKDLFCAVMNPNTGAYIDLSELSSTPNRQESQDKNNRHNTDTETPPPAPRWLVRGWGYNTNFTLSICSSPVSKLEEDRLSNLTGGSYVDPNDHTKLVSIGNFGTKPTLLGGVGSKKLTMKYENGSKCPNGKDSKSTLLNFVCDRDLSSRAQISFIGSLHDCSYFFEVRSIYACPTSNKVNEVNVVGIFIGIFFVFLMVELGRRSLSRRTSSQGYARYQDISSADDDANADEMGLSTNIHPRWSRINGRSRWREAFSGISRLIQRIFGRNGRSQGANGNRPLRYPIRLRSTSDISSDTTFLRDMEAQNEILDSIDMPEGDDSSSMVTGGV
ncbi:hypothetical protein NCAS_0I01010 [Naumovozyma castellii]|uniref:MRH domain-containing protein n=1 Tax=Naumovozyma castellii TaxID=27288 RepID=G0VJT8_NAUCA|nr:hypothetical protein NCAS_0I01010 [Naumovozyma castellii CBS 4309]CCC71769.1 hypothetical protein NCAS_0I01010 [Naumovozyma castellii CBS 4309]